MPRSFKLYSIATAVAAVILLWTAGWDVSTRDLGAQWNAVAAFLVLGFLAEASYIRLSVGRTETQSSVAFIPFIASVLLFDTGWAALVAAGSVLAVESAVKRKAALRVLFNVSQMVVSVALASLVYGALGGQFSLTDFRIARVAIAGAVATYFIVNSAAVSAAVALSYGGRLSDAWLRIAGASLAYDVFSSLLGPLLAFLYVQFQIPGILLLILPLYFLRHLYHVTLQLEQVNRELLELMVKAIEARDPYTSGHSQRVSQIASQIAKDYGLGHKLVEQITTSALLHDVGKIYEDFAPLLRKDTKLDSTERALMQTHPARSAELVGTISAFRGPIEQAVRHHHENFDGTGYPMKLAGRAIPIGARIVMVADTLDAMTTDRPYRKALSYERVIEELQRFSGRQFDPELVDRVIRSPAIRLLVTARVSSQEDSRAGPEVLTSLRASPMRSSLAGEKLGSESGGFLNARRRVSLAELGKPLPTKSIRTTT
jgi:HD-GYP domain-containing protein (c-di-GMP phosphodiesterase class II)